MIDWSATAAWVTLALTLVVSIVSPVITTWMNHRFQLKMLELEAHNKEKELHYLKKRAVIDSFIANTGKCIFRANSDSLRECGESFYSIYIYVPEILWKEIDELRILIKRCQWEAAQEHFAELSKKLSELLEESDR